MHGHANPNSSTAFFLEKSLKITKKNSTCVSSWWLNHPSEKYARQTGSFPQIGMKILKKNETTTQVCLP